MVALGLFGVLFFASRPPDLQFDLGAVDDRVDPCVDFYEFACGGWRRTHPIPTDRARWSRYTELTEVNLERVRSIVEGADKTTRIGRYYAACIDRPSIETRGLDALHDLFSKIGAIEGAASGIDVIVELHAHGVPALFESFAAPNSSDVRTTLLWIAPGSLGMPARDDYVGTSSASAELRVRYRDHLVRLFRLVDPSSDGSKEADRVIAFEIALAKNALSPVDERDPDAQHHPMSIDELERRYGAIAWPKYFQALGLSKVEHVNVAVPKWMGAANAALLERDASGLRAYLRATVLRAFANVLPKAIEDEVFSFRGRVLKGTREMPPLWKRCLDLVDRDLGDDVGRIFLARHFSNEAAARMKMMVDALIASFRADIESIEWLSERARRAALTKLSMLLVSIGGSNRMRAYEGLDVNEHDAFGNAWRARSHEATWDRSQIGAPTDRQRFFDALPQELDGFGAHRMNAVGFTAGFLQPPVFDPRLDDAVNFGGLGSVIGHELTHHFDDEGRKFDVDGNLRPWWSKEDVTRYEVRARCFSDEYARFKTDEGTPLNGKLTLGENIADNGGIRLSYQALHPSETGPRIGGYTPAQRFFLAWGQIRCENVTPEAMRRQALTDGHSAGRWRVNGVVSNMPEFARAFSCAKEKPMAPPKRCRLW
jgi:endothelin-converting enzyme/putative endopeptidase